MYIPNIAWTYLQLKLFFAYLKFNLTGCPVLLIAKSGISTLAALGEGHSFIVHPITTAWVLTKVSSIRKIIKLDRDLQSRAGRNFVEGCSRQREQHRQRPGVECYWACSREG